MIEELTLGLNERKIQTDVLCAAASSKTQIEDKGGYRIIRAGRVIHFASTAISYKLIYWLWKLRKDYDIIHFHHPDPMATLAYLLVRPRAKLVLHWHSDIVKQKLIYFFFRFLEYQLLKKADKIIVTSPPYLESSRPLIRFQSKTEVIPIGIDLTSLSVDKKKLKEVKEKYKGKVIVFSLGRNTAYKGYRYLLEAMKELPERYILLLAGSGVPTDKELSMLAIEPDLLGRVFLMDSIVGSELGSFFSAADVFVLPSVSRNEAFGIVQVEAMNQGTPVVSTRIPGSGVSWVNQHEESGLTVPSADASMLAQAIQRIGDDKALRKKLSAGAKKRAKESFSREAMLGKIQKLYSATL